MTNYQEKYIKYKLKYLQASNSIQNGGTNKTVYLFKAEWCGHCQNFKPTWNKIKNNMKGVDFVEYDSDLNKSEIQQWDIKGYPTIMVKNGLTATEYNGKREQADFEKFIKSV
jgi:thiol-disulfide isomerase/thioredoxin